jgi:hypothetical protein
LSGALDRPATLTCLRHREQAEHPMMVKWVIEVAVSIGTFHTHGWTL